MNSTGDPLFTLPLEVTNNGCEYFFSEVDYLHDFEYRTNPRIDIQKYISPKLVGDSRAFANNIEKFFETKELADISTPPPPPDVRDEIYNLSRDTNVYKDIKESSLYSFAAQTLSFTKEEQIAHIITGEDKFVRLKLFQPVLKFNPVTDMSQFLSSILNISKDSSSKGNRTVLVVSRLQLLDGECFLAFEQAYYSCLAQNHHVNLFVLEDIVEGFDPLSFFRPEDRLLFFSNLVLRDFVKLFNDVVLQLFISTEIFVLSYISSITNASVVGAVTELPPPESQEEDFISGFAHHLVHRTMKFLDYTFTFLDFKDNPHLNGGFFNGFVFNTNNILVIPTLHNYGLVLTNYSLMLPLDPELKKPMFLECSVYPVERSRALGDQTKHYCDDLIRAVSRKTQPKQKTGGIIETNPANFVAEAPGLVLPRPPIQIALLVSCKSVAVRLHHQGSITEIAVPQNDNLFLTTLRDIACQAFGESFVSDHTICFKGWATEKELFFYSAVRVKPHVDVVYPFNDIHLVRFFKDLNCTLRDVLFSLPPPAYSPKSIPRTYSIRFADYYSVINGHRLNAPNRLYMSPGKDYQVHEVICEDILFTMATYTFCGDMFICHKDGDPVFDTQKRFSMLLMTKKEFDDNPIFSREIPDRYSKIVDEFSEKIIDVEYQPAYGRFKLLSISPSAPSSYEALVDFHFPKVDAKLTPFLYRSFKIPGNDKAMFLFMIVGSGGNQPNMLDYYQQKPPCELRRFINDACGSAFLSMLTKNKLHSLNTWKYRGEDSTINDLSLLFPVSIRLYRENFTKHKLLCAIPKEEISAFIEKGFFAHAVGSFSEKERGNFLYIMYHSVKKVLAARSVISFELLSDMMLQLSGRKLRTVKVVHTVISDTPTGSHHAVISMLGSSHAPDSKGVYPPGSFDDYFFDFTKYANYLPAGYALKYIAAFKRHHRNLLPEGYHLYRLMQRNVGYDNRKLSVLLIIKANSTSVLATGDDIPDLYFKKMEYKPRPDNPRSEKRRKKRNLPKKRPRLPRRPTDL